MKRKGRARRTKQNLGAHRQAIPQHFPIVIETDGGKILADEALEIMFYAAAALGAISIIVGLWAVWRDVGEL